mgnify:CR=1 FL=1|jgi:putative addiction module killer protein
MQNEEIKVETFEDENGKRPFDEWALELPINVSAHVTVTVPSRMQRGLLSQTKSVGDGVSEYVIDKGPGYRVYFAKDGNKLIILLGGSTKNGQQNAIDSAKACWLNYKQRKAALKTSSKKS